MAAHAAVVGVGVEPTCLVFQASALTAIASQPMDYHLSTVVQVAYVPTSLLNPQMFFMN